MSDQDKIISFLKTNGPSLPSKIAKTINTEILFASAQLSDLAAQGKLKISSIKIGGSPLYYLPGQEHQLYKFASGNLNPKDVDVLNTLRDKKLLREKELELLYKVSLRSLKDFAIPLHVTFDGKTELFWKWHLASKEDVNDLINKMISGKEELAVPVQTVSPTPVPHSASPVPSEIKIPSPAVIELKAEIFSLPKVPELRKEFSSVQSTLPLVEKKEEMASPTLKTRKVSKQKEKSSIKAKDESSIQAVEEYFTKLKIIIDQKEVVRKNAEYNFVVRVPSAVGSMVYFCKAKQKGKCDEKDLSAAYMEAQIKKLPLLLLYTGELTKKALDMLQTEAFQNAVVKKVE